MSKQRRAGAGCREWRRCCRQRRGGCAFDDGGDAFKSVSLSRGLEGVSIQIIWFWSDRGFEGGEIGGIDVGEIEMALWRRTRSKRR